MKKQIVALATKSDAVLIPKPSKAEVVEALVKAAKVEHEAKEKAERDKLDAIKKEVIELLLRDRGNWMFDRLDGDSFNHYGDENIVTVNVPVQRTKAVAALIKKMYTGNEVGYFRERNVREQITSAMRADPRRVAALAESPEIKAMLASIKSIYSK